MESIEDKMRRLVKDAVSRFGKNRARYETAMCKLVRVSLLSWWNSGEAFRLLAFYLDSEESADAVKSIIMDLVRLLPSSCTEDSRRYATYRDVTSSVVLHLSKHVDFAFAALQWLTDEEVKERHALPKFVAAGAVEICGDGRKSVRSLARKAVRKLQDDYPRAVIWKCEDAIYAPQYHSDDTRWEAVRILSRFLRTNPEDANLVVNVLCKACGDSDRGVKAKAVREARRLFRLCPQERERIKSKVFRACDDTKGVVRVAAVRQLPEALKVFPGEADVITRKLLRLCEDGKKVVRLIALRQLPRAAKACPAVGESLVTEFVERYGKLEGQDRVFAVGGIPDAIEASPGVAEQLTGSLIRDALSLDDVTRAAAMRQLAMAAKAYPGITQEGAQDLVSPLLRGCRDYNEEVRYGAALHLSLATEACPSFGPRIFKETLRFCCSSDERCRNVAHAQVIDVCRHNPESVANLLLQSLINSKRKTIGDDGLDAKRNDCASSRQSNKRRRRSGKTNDGPSSGQSNKRPRRSNKTRERSRGLKRKNPNNPPPHGGSNKKRA